MFLMLFSLTIHRIMIILKDNPLNRYLDTCSVISFPPKHTKISIELFRYYYVLAVSFKNNSSLCRCVCFCFDFFLIN